MDPKGLGRKLLLTPSGDTLRTPEKQTVGTVTASHRKQKMLTLDALSSSLNAGTAEGGCLGRGEAFGCPPAVCPPKRPRPFTHCKCQYQAPLCIEQLCLLGCWLAAKLNELFWAMVPVAEAGPLFSAPKSHKHNR